MKPTLHLEKILKIIIMTRSNKLLNLNWFAHEEGRICATQISNVNSDEFILKPPVMFSASTLRQAEKVRLKALYEKCENEIDCRMCKRK